MRINIDEEDELKSIFEANKSPQRIIELLSMIGGEKIFHNLLTEACNYYLIIGGMPD